MRSQLRTLLVLSAAVSCLTWLGSLRAEGPVPTRDFPPPDPPPAKTATPCPPCPCAVSAGDDTLTVESARNTLKDLELRHRSIQADLDPTRSYEFDLPSAGPISSEVLDQVLGKTDDRNTKVLTKFIWDPERLNPASLRDTPVRAIKGKLQFPLGAVGKDSAGTGSATISQPFATSFGTVGPKAEDDAKLHIHTAVRLTDDDGRAHYGDLVGDFTDYEIADSGEALFTGKLRLLLDLEDAKGTHEVLVIGYENLPIQFRLIDTEPVGVLTQSFDPRIQPPAPPAETEKTSADSGKKKPTAEKKPSGEKAKKPATPRDKTPPATVAQTATPQTMTVAAVPALREVRGGGCDASESGLWTALGALLVGLLSRRKRFVADRHTF